MVSTLIKKSYAKEAKIPVFFSISLILTAFLLIYLISAATVDSSFPTDNTNASLTTGYNGQETNQSFNGTDPQFHCEVQVDPTGNVSNVSLYISDTPVDTDSAVKNETQNTTFLAGAGGVVFFNVSSLNEGYHYWFCETYNNISTEGTNTSTNRTLIIDLSPPGFQDVSVSTTTPSTESVLAVGINVTDAFTTIDTVRLFVNVSGASDNEVNITSADNGVVAANNASINFTYVITPDLAGQTLNVTFQVNDSVNNVNITAAQIITVADATVPGPITLVSPLDYHNQSQQQLNFTFNASDNLDSTLRCDINISEEGTTIQAIVLINATSATNQTNQTVTALPSGRYDWSVNCSDTAGNVNQSISRRFTIDNDPPGFRDVSITSSASTGSIVAVGVNVTDFLSNISEVGLYVNVSGFTENQVNISNSINNNSLVNLTYVILENQTGQVLNFTIFATDNLSSTNITLASTLTVTDVTIPGPITLNGPADLVNISDNTPTFNFTATDNSNGPLTCTINISQGGTKSASSIEVINATSGVHQLNTSGTLSDGTYNWSVNCTDTAGNTNQSIARSFTVDTVPPAFNTVSATHTTASVGDVVYLNVTWNDTTTNPEVALLYVNVSGATNNIVNSTNITIQNRILNLSYTIASGLDTAVLNFTMYMNDSAGNFNLSTTQTVTVSDSTVPGPITLNGPTNNLNTSDTTPTFNFTATDASGVLTCDINISSSGSISQSIAGIQPTSGEHQLNTTPSALSDGVYDWSVNCTDSSSNVNQSVARTFTVDTVVPAYYNVSLSHTTASPGDTVHLSVVWNDTTTNPEEAYLYVNVSGATNNIVNATNVTISNNKINLSYVIAAGTDAAVLNFTMYMNDSAGNFNITANQTIKLTDTNAPTITVVRPDPAATNYGVSMFVPNITVSSDAVECKYSVNNTGTTANHTMLKTGTTCLGSTERFKSLLDVYNITFYAIDSSNNVGSLRFDLNMSDTTPPNGLNATYVSASVSTTSATITISNMNESVNATVSFDTEITASDETTSQTDFNTSQSLSLSSLTAATLYYYNVTVCDFVGNCANNSFNFTTDAASSSSSSSSSSSGGGGGGGGGGATTGATTVSSTARFWSTISAGDTTTMNVDKEDIAVSSIEFTARSDLADVDLSVASLNENPVSEDTPATVFQYLEIDEVNADEDDLSEVVVTFRVADSWYTSNGLDRATTVLYRYTNDWDPMETTFVDFVGTEREYQATIPGFSFFAIGADELSEEDDTTDETTDEEDTETEQTEEPEEQEPPAVDDTEPRTRSSSLLFLSIFVFICLVIGLVLYLQKTK